LRILVLGASYTGRFLAANFPEHLVRFASRDSAKLASLNLIADSEDNYDLILDTVPAIKSENGIALPYLDLCRRHPEAILVHISSTSVFAEKFTTAHPADLPVFDETAEASPQTNRGLLRLELEGAIRAHFPEAFVLRAGGIYGPGRCIAIQFQKKDFRRADSGNRVVSRIHVYDLCALALALAKKRKRFRNL